MRRQGYPRLTISLATLLYAEGLRWCFEHVISPTFYYLGERYREPGFLSFQTTCALAFLVSLTLPQRQDDSSRFATAMLFFVLWVPLITVPQYVQYLDASEAHKLSWAGALAALLANIAGHRRPSSIVPLITVSPEAIYRALACAAIVLITYVVTTSGIDSLSWDYSAAYDIRSTYRESVKSAPGLGYAVRLLGNAVGPALLALGATHRRPMYGALGTVSLLTVFSATGYKTALLTGAIILAIALARRFGDISAARIAIVAAASTWLISLLDASRQTTTLSAVFVDRLAITSGFLPSAYYYFFSRQPHTWWSGSVLGHLLGSATSGSPGEMIGIAMTGNMDVNNNSNFMGDGFAQAGWIGVVFEFATMLILFHFVRSAARGLDPTLATALLVGPFFSLANSSPITALISSGFILLVPILAILPRYSASTRSPAVSGSTGPHSSAKSMQKQSTGRGLHDPRPAAVLHHQR